MTTKAELIAWLKSPDSVRVILVEIPGVIDTLGNTNTFYFSNKPYVSRPTDNPANKIYIAAISGGVTFSENISLDGSASISSGDIELDNTDNVRTGDSWLNYIWSSRDITILIGDATWSRSDFYTIFTGTIKDIDSKSRNSVNLILVNNLDKLNISLTEKTIGGTDVNKDELLPLTFGECFNIQPVLLNKNILEYQVHNGPVERFIEVRDNGAPLVGSSLPAFNTLTGKFTLSTQAAGTITASVQGSKQTGLPYTSRIGSVIADIITNYVNTSEYKVTVTASTTNVTETSPNNVVVFTVTPNFTGTVYWTTFGTLGNITTADFTDNTINSGAISVTTGTSFTVTRTLAADNATEGTEKFILQFRTGSSTGDIIGVSPEITVADTSTTILAPTITFSAGNTSGQTTAVTSLVMDVPAGEAGNLQRLLVVARQNGSSEISLNTPSGWTLASGTPIISAGGNSAKLYIFNRTLSTNISPGTVTVTTTGATGALVGFACNLTRAVADSTASTTGSFVSSIQAPGASVASNNSIRLQVAAVTAYPRKLVEPDDNATYSQTTNYAFVTGSNGAGINVAWDFVNSPSCSSGAVWEIRDAYIDTIKKLTNVKVATTVNITLSGTQTIDGVSVAANDRVLVKNQTTQSQNGIYVVNTGSWARATDYDTSAEVAYGDYVYVDQGTDNANKGFAVTTSNPITLGTTNLTFTEFTAKDDAIAYSAIFGTVTTGGYSTVVAINCGGEEYVSANGIIYLSDRHYEGGNTASTTDAIANTTDDPVYQTERWGTCTYTIPLTPGTYRVRVLLAEIYNLITGSNQRVFDIKFQPGTANEQVQTNIDVYATVGADTATEIQKDVVVGSSGQLVIQTLAQIQNPAIKGILIQSNAGGVYNPAAPPSSVTPPLPETTVIRTTNFIIPQEFVGMHMYTVPFDVRGYHSWGTATPPTFAYGLRRSLNYDGIFWRDIHKTSNSANWVWTDLDNAINHTLSKGAKFLYTFMYTPEHLVSVAGYPSPAPAWTGSTSMPTNLTEVAQFVTALVQRYNSGSVKKLAAIEVWNEPDINGTDFLTESSVVSYWIGSVASNNNSINNSAGYKTQRLNDLALLHKTIAVAAKAADPDILIVGPGWSPGGGAQQSSAWLNYFNRSISGGGTPLDYTDIFACHPYTGAGNSGDAATASSVIYAVLGDYNNCRNVTAASKPLWGTEAGNEGTSQSLAQHATVIKRKAIIAAGVGMSSLHYYAYEDDFYLGNPYQNTTTSNALAEITTKMVGRTITRCSILNDGSVWAAFSDGTTYRV